MKVELSLVGVGWIVAKLSDEDSTCAITASYLGDAMGDLLTAVWMLMNDDRDPRCSWWEEPGEYRWLFGLEGDDATLRILEFDQLYGDEPDGSGRLVFATSQPRAVLAAAIAKGARTLLAEHGADGYREKWLDHDFPTDLLVSIERLVSEPG